MTRATLPERIETERLVLRVRTVADAEDIFDYASLPEVSYPAGFPPVKTLEDEIYYLEHILPERNQRIIFQQAMELLSKGLIKSSALLISTIATKTMCWRLAIPCTQTIGDEGYVPEAARALIDLGFKDLGLHKIELACFGYNVQSQRVAEKLGFHP